MSRIVTVLLALFILLGNATYPATPVLAQSTALKASATKAANLRAGPGTTYAVVGGLKAKEEFEIAARNADGSWFQIKKKDGLIGWVAAFLVKSAPALDLIPIAQNIPALAVAPTSAPAQVPTPAPVQAPAPLPEFGVTKQCGHFEYKLYDLRKVKSVWLFDSEYIAQGNFLLIFVEVKNISTGTSYFGKFGPRLVLAAPSQRLAAADDSWRGGFRAGWMFQAGSIYDDVNPGLVLGEVEAYDLPLDRDFQLVYDLYSCPGQSISLGMWSAITKGSKK